MSAQTDVLFQEIYEDYYQKVLSYIRSKVGDHHIAEDLTSDVFFKCYKNIENYDPAKAGISTWVFTITSNLLKNYYRDRKQTISLDARITGDEDGREMMDTLAAEDPTPEEITVQAARLEEIRAYLDEAMAELDETKQRILVMRYYDEMKTKDIADKLGLTESNVRVTLSRLLKRLNIEARSSGIMQVL